MFGFTCKILAKVHLYHTRSSENQNHFWDIRKFLTCNVSEWDFQLFDHLLLLSNETFKKKMYTWVMWSKLCVHIYARNEVGARLCFYTCLWFCSQGVGGGSPGPHLGGRLRGLARGESPGPHPGGKLRGLAGGGSPWPTPRGMSARGCLPHCMLGYTPPTTTAAGGTHPTGMHSCLHFKITSTLNICALVLARIGFISQASTGLDQFLDSYEHLLTSFQQQMWYDHNSGDPNYMTIFDILNVVAVRISRIKEEKFSKEAMKRFFNGL